MNKWMLLLGAVVVWAGCKPAEGSDAKKENATASEVVAEVHADDLWMTDFAAASKKAKAEGKHMLLDFSGSDWCGWCMKLDKEVFSQDAFIKYAKENLVLVVLDFPRSTKLPAELTKQNEDLAQKYGIRGFPTVLILDSDGKTVAKTGYQAGGPEAYVASIKEMIGK